MTRLLDQLSAATRAKVEAEIQPALVETESPDYHPFRGSRWECGCVVNLEDDLVTVTPCARHESIWKAVKVVSVPV